MTTQAPPTTGVFCWHELNSPQPDKAREFFNKLFGWTTSEMPMDDFMYHVLMHGEEGFGGVMDTSGPEWKGVPPHWMTYISVDDVDAAAKKVTELGGHVCVPPTDIKVGRFSVVSDPTGGTFSLFKSSDGPSPAHQSIICWNELMTTDAAKAKDFYTKMFGWGTDSMDMDKQGTYYMFNHGTPESASAGMMEMHGPHFEGVPSHWMPYAMCESVDDTAGKVEALGGKLQVPPTDIGNDKGRIAVLIDPTGAALGLYQPPAGAC